MRKFFGKSDEKWDWENFETTEGFPVSPDLMDWIVGQDKAIKECELSLDEWIHKLKYIKKRKLWKPWEKPEYEKPQAKEWLPPGPFLLLIGTPGTGKSLLGRALTSHLTKLYKKHKIQLYDVVSWKNEVIPSEPRISIHPSPEGRKLVKKEKKQEAKKGFLKKWAIRILQVTLGTLGVILLSIGFYQIFKPWMFNDIIQRGYVIGPAHTLYGNFFDYAMDKIIGWFPVFLGGGSLLFYAIFVSFFGRFFRGNSGMKGVGGAEASDAPKLLVDNSDGNAKFIDATGHGSAQLYGSIAWDPYQTGGLGTPEHQRVGAGDVHRAFMGILYIDEIKNLSGQEAVTLLTVLEDGQLPIALRSQWHGGDTAAMAVSTEPVPCMLFFVAAGNLDSVSQIHPALMDRIAGYGKVVYMNDDMENTIDNRRKYVQFITQEIQRFNLLPFSREACIELVEESRRKSDRKDRLSCLFRPTISIIKTASVLAMNEDLKIVGANHVKEAIEEHCKSIRMQVLEERVEKVNMYRIVNPKAKPIKGQINGMAVSSYKSGEKIGVVLPIKTSVEKLPKKSSGYFRVTGVNTKDDSWIQSSISKVTTIIQQRYKHKDKLGIHVDFAQNIGVDGPSAGVAMVLTIISLLENKKIRQDTTVTGEINVSIGKQILVTPVGGVHEKIIAAEKSGFKRVLIPKRNYEVNINQKDYKIKVIPCETLNDYINEVLVKK